MKGFFLLVFPLVACLYSCSSSKFVPEGQHVLSSVELTSDDDKLIDASSLRNYVRQEPNARWFNLVKVPLGLYCISGRDSTKGINRFFRRIGEPPVLYDSTLAHYSRNNLKMALNNRGFLRAKTDVKVKEKNKKIKLKYTLRPGQLYHIRTISYAIDDAGIARLLAQNENKSLLRIKMPCDANILDQERDRIVALLHRNGYYNFLKNYIRYDIDSLQGPDRLNLKLKIEGKTISKDSSLVYTQYRIRNILVDVNLENETSALCDSMDYMGLKLRYYGKRQIRPSVIHSQIQFIPHRLYNEDNLQATYRNFSNLQALRYAVIRMEPADSGRLDCHITLQANKVNAISSEIEGTNTSGDMGIAASVSFANRNLFRGSETWTTKLRGAFEAISGLEGYNDQDFFEISAETHLSFPRIIFPFLKEERRRHLSGSSELSLLYNSQNRPEFHRRVLTGAWSYRRQSLSGRVQQKVDAVSVNYVFMPWISSTFKREYLDSISDRSAIIRYSYENLFIVNSSYSYTYNSAGSAANGSLYQKNAYQVHFNIESAGNLLYLIANAAGTRRNDDGNRTLFNIAFAQYVKFDFDYARSFLLNSRNSFAVHTAFGLALPYGNATVIPFEKRYFAGGPNSVRGWSVRELGPGSYTGKDGKVDFINQTGNLKLLFNVEWRSYLFWKLHGALFIDAGNIWNTRNYADQAGGQFRFDSFYKQIAASYGFGLRLNLDFFILRLDWGMKAVNPAYESGKRHFPIINPNIGRDLTFHFAVGLPF